MPIKEWIPRDAEVFADGFWRQPAQEKAVLEVLNGQRSGWYFIRLPDGNLVIACYPQANTYEATEQYRTI